MGLENAVSFGRQFPLPELPELPERVTFNQAELLALGIAGEPLLPNVDTENLNTSTYTKERVSPFKDRRDSETNTHNALDADIDIFVNGVPGHLPQPSAAHSLESKTFVQESKYHITSGPPIHVHSYP